MTKVYMVAPYEDCYGYHMASARMFSRKEDAYKYCEKKNAEDNSWEVEEYDVDDEV